MFMFMFVRFVLRCSGHDTSQSQSVSMRMTKKESSKYYYTLTLYTLVIHHARCGRRPSQREPSQVGNGDALNFTFSEIKPV